MKSQPISIKRRQFLESILGHEVHADEMQKYENMAKANDLARVGDILEKGAVNRRDFLKCGGLAALLGGIAAVSNNCAGGSVILGGVKETGPVHYPRLPGHKIQSPEHYGLEGCMVGYYFNRYGWDEPNDIIPFYERKVGKTPSIILLPIPLKSSSCSDLLRPAVPKVIDQSFRNIPTRKSERSDAGIFVISQSFYLESRMNVIFALTLLSN